MYYSQKTGASRHLSPLLSKRRAQLLTSENSLTAASAVDTHSLGLPCPGPFSTSPPRAGCFLSLCRPTLMSAVAAVLPQQHPPPGCCLQVHIVMRKWTVRWEMVKNSSLIWTCEDLKWWIKAIHFLHPDFTGQIMLKWVVDGCLGVWSVTQQFKWCDQTEMCDRAAAALHGNQ